MTQALAYLQLNPPEKAANRRTASILAQIATWAGKTMKEGSSVTADDYLSKPQKPLQSAEDQKAFFMRFPRKENGS